MAGILCQHCKRTVKHNQIIRDSYHVLGCVHCYGSPTLIMVAEAEAARQSKAVENAPTPRVFGAFGAFGVD